MAYENQVHLLGNLTADPDVKKVGPTTVASFTVAVNTRGKDRKPHGEFFPCEVWGGWADNFVKTAKIGALVAVYGRLKQDSWEDKTSKEKRSRVLVRADRAYHLESQFGGEEPTSESPA